MSTLPPKQTRRQWWALAGLIAAVMGASEGWQWWQQERNAAAVQQYAQAGDIVMYTTSTCPYCARARRWLDAHQVPWHECNVELDSACLKVFEAQGSPGVPLMSVKGRWNLGFDAAWLGQALQAPSVSKPKPKP
ncbi:MAG: glutaredoxin family protein [Burkholderiales bacterium]|nr:glutaredoxin family protein [Burkholderiales bacterium]